MKTLAERFEKLGWVFEQVKRVGNAAIYRKSKPRVESFEVIKIREGAAGSFRGIEFQASERYPSSEEWGIAAWTYMDLAGANKRLATLIPSES